jgi:transcriptional regulator with XRE-family HTH domain
MTTNTNVFLAARLRKGLTKAEVCRLTGLTPKTLYRLELGQNDPTWATVQLLARVYGVSLERLRQP